MKNLRIFAIIFSLALLLAHSPTAFAQEVSVDEAFGLQAEIGTTLDAGSATAEPLTLTDLQAVLVPDAEAQEFRIRFAWELSSDEAIQTAYQVLIASVGNYIDDNTGDVWDSGRVSSDAHVITVGESETFFRALPAGTYFWKVRVWDADGTATEYSPAQRFYFLRRETALQSGEPTSPLAATGTAISANEIRWEFTDRASNETGFALFNDHDELVVTTAPATVADYYYLTERSLKPNTAYAGRTVRAFNNAGLSAPSQKFATIYTRAATPGELRYLRVADDKFTLVIDPRKNPAGTEYSVLDTSTGEYIDGVGSRAQQPLWLPLETWQQVAIPVSEGPYALAVQARNGDHVPTPYSPVLTIDQTDAPLPLDLTFTGEVLRGGAILGAQRVNTSVFTRIIHTVAVAGPRAAVALLIAGALGLWYVIQRRDRRFRGFIDTLVHVVKHEPQQVFATHMDRDAISHGRYLFMHRFAHVSATVAVVIGLFSAGATLAERITLTESEVPSGDVLTQALDFSDVIRFRLTYAVTGSQAVSDPYIAVTLPAQLALIEHSIQTSKDYPELNATSDSFSIYYGDFGPAERGTVTFLAQVRQHPELGGTQAVASVRITSGARSAVTPDVTFTLQQTEEQLVGMAVKTPSSPELWFIRPDATRAYIPDIEIFNQRFNGDQKVIRTITQTELELFPIGSNLRYRPGTLVQLGGTGVIYEIMDEDGSLQPLTDEEVDKKLAIGGAVVDIPEERYADYLR